jgi:heme exporter protein C
MSNPAINRINKIAPWVALVGILYVLIGGLFLPLEPGIIGVDRSILHSDSIQKSKIFTYKLPENAVITNIWLRTSIKNKQGKFDFFKVSVDNSQTAGKDGFIGINTNISLGSSSTKNQDLDLMVEYNNETMYLPKAYYLKRSDSDTSVNQANSTPYTTKQRNSQFSLDFPNRVTLNESIRNLFYHVPMWFSMILLLAVAAIYGVMYLTKGNLTYEYRFDALIKVGIVCGILGMITGASWARATWGSWWPKDDPKLNGVAIGMLMYFAYLVLRSTLTDPYQKARISAIYSVFIFPIFIALIAIMPKLADNSLHPGSGDSVGFNQYDLNATLRMFFWPAVLSWMALFWWIADIVYRIRSLEELKLQKEYEENA